MLVIEAETMQVVQRCNACPYLGSVAGFGGQHLRLGPVAGLGGLDLRLGPVVGACGRDVRQWARRGGWAGGIWPTTGSSGPSLKGPGVYAECEIVAIRAVGTAMTMIVM